MPVHEAPDDDEARETYNFAPGNFGLVYRADVPDWGAGGQPRDKHEHEAPSDTVSGKTATEDAQATQSDKSGETRYKLQTMKWGLVPFWTKRNPDYGSLMRTINARDDSLAAKGGMWATMKQRKRCIIIAQGFYEWLKKNGGKEKIPHYTKRKDGQLMCFAGLWDCVKYEDSDEKHYTYSIITTDSNKQLSFLHDRMPVILENGSDEITTWLDPGRAEWSKDLQSLLRPYEGELECYPVSKEVGKVGNNSPSFIIPVASSENKHNIANFFGNAKKTAKTTEVKKELRKEEEQNLKDDVASVKKEEDEDRDTVDQSTTEDNAPLPAPSSIDSPTKRVKREHSQDDVAEEAPTTKLAKTSDGPIPPSVTHSPIKKKTPASAPSSGKKTRSATSNQTAKASPTKSDGSQKITSFLKQR